MGVICAPAKIGKTGKNWLVRSENRSVQPENIAKDRKKRNLFVSDVQQGSFSGNRGVWYISPLRFIDFLMTAPPPSSIFSENAAPRQNQI